ncbi:MAG TPA: hypothetical protein VFS40_00700 [Gemmatimonadales bacterium]|nr:hypothetical protein [Gemmatimonadales bacterium]
MTKPTQPTPFPTKLAEPLLPRHPAWLLPAVMVVLGLAGLAGMFLDPAHKWMWGFVPYTFLGNSLAPLPYDGYVIALGKNDPIWLIVVVGTLGTMLIEQWNMELLARILAREGTRGFRAHPLTRWAVRMYERAPFVTLVATCILPIVPHYPMRILATLARYPMWKYQLTVLIGRGGRYAWLAALGWALHIPEKWIVIASVILLVFAYRGARKMNRYEEPAEAMSAVLGDAVTETVAPPPRSADAEGVA